MGNYRYLDMETYRRRAHFEYFSGLAYPYVGVTVQVDLTELLRKIKNEELPFFFTICYCVSRAANRTQEFRQRIRDGKIIEFDRCRTSHTVALEDGTFCYCTLADEIPFTEYLPYATREQEEAKREGSIEETEEDIYDKFFVSTVPWISYTSLIQPTPVPADSNPRITWGKYYAQGERILLPVSVLCHHALVDGRHIADFYQSLDKEIELLCGQEAGGEC